jgi:TRAP transporter TAXI family solute receptor
MTHRARRVLRFGLVSAVVVIALGAGLLVANRFAGPLPPRTLTMSTGREDGAYYQFAAEYRRLLARQGFQLTLRPGAGSVETLQRLTAGEVDVGFVQGGASGGRHEGLTALGSMFYEPLWVFHRKAVRLGYLSDLKGRRLAVGEEGSGTRALVLQLLRDSGVTAGNSSLVGLSSSGAEAALVQGTVDAAFFVISPRAELVLRLLRQPGVELMSERRHLAYAGRYAFLTSLRLGEGMLDMAGNLPQEEKHLLATTAALVVRDGIHPDLVRLLLGAAERVHRRGGMLEPPGAFPSPALVELPINEQAVRYLRSGPPWVERVLPFWAAGLLDRSVLVVLPMLTVLFPFFGLVLPMLDRRHRRRIARWYELLRACDTQCATLSMDGVEAEIQRMRALEREVTEHAKLPPLYLGELYNLKMHIGLILERLEARRRALQAAADRP